MRPRSCRSLTCLPGRLPGPRRCHGCGPVMRWLRAIDPGPFLELIKADTGSMQATDRGPSPELGKADTRWLRPIDPGPFPELGKADTRSGKGPGSITRDTASAASSSLERRLEPQRSDRFVSGCMRRASRRAWDAARSGVSLYRPTSRAGAAYHKQPIGGLPPSACLPFQARGKAPDRLLASSPCLPCQVQGKAPDRLLASSACLPFQARGKAPDRLLASSACLPFRAKRQIALLKRCPDACTDGRYASKAIAR